MLNTRQSSWSTKSYGEAQQQLLRILAHHMVQIAERASILDEKADKMHLIESANRQWDGQATFEWYLTDNSASEKTEDPQDVDSQRSCFSCGAFLCPNELCLSCLSQSSDGSIWEESNFSGKFPMETSQSARLSPEALESMSRIWDFGCSQALDTELESSTCHSCGMIVMFPGDSLCFSCFSYSSEIQGDTSLTSSSEDQFFMKDPPLLAPQSTWAPVANNSMRDLLETRSTGPSMQGIIPGCDDNADKLAQDEKSEGNHWYSNNLPWYNLEQYPGTINASDEWERCEVDITDPLMLRKMDSHVSNYHQPTSASLSNFGRQHRRRSRGKLSDRSRSRCRHLRETRACVRCKLSRAMV